MRTVKKLFFSLFCLILLIGCNQETKLVYPPDDAVNRVTDFYFFNDGKTFLYLSSNMNRRYDFGLLVLMRLDEENKPFFIDSLIVPSIAGKMAVTADETKVYVATRDMHGVVRVSISGKSDAYRLKYDDETDGDIPKILKTKKEPYALKLSPDESKLLVTHLLNGELSIVDTAAWEVKETLKLKQGVTDIIYDEISGYYLASHRSSGNISLIQINDALDGFDVSAKEIPIELPTNGYDVRSLKQSSDKQKFYASFQNSYDEDKENYEEDVAPQLVTFKLNDLKIEISDSLAINGSVAELAVMPYSSGSEGGEIGGDLIFLALPSEEKLLLVDSERNKIRAEISYKDSPKECKPYQLYAKSIGNSKGYLLVSCFSNDLIFLYEIDLSSDELFKEIGVIE